MAQKKTVAASTKQVVKSPGARTEKAALKTKPAAKAPHTAKQKATGKQTGKSQSSNVTTGKAKAGVATKPVSKSVGVKGAKVQVAVKSVAKAAPVSAKQNAASKVSAKAGKSSAKPAVAAKAKSAQAAAKAPAKPAAKQVATQPKKPQQSAKASAPQAKPVVAPQAKPIAPQAKPALPTGGRSPMTPAAVASARAESQRSAGKVVPAAVSPTPGQSQKVSAPMTGNGQPPVAAPKDVAQKAAQSRDDGAKKSISQKHGFKTNEFIVYPAHGVGRIVGIEEQEIAGMSLELFVITFEKDKMTLRVPTAKLASVGMRKLAEEGTVKRALEILKGRARVKRTMWSRRAQEYEAKINSGDLVSIAEVVRDLYRSESQPEQSYSERQLYEAALDRMARELAAVERLDDRGAVQRITEVLSKSAKSRRAAEDATAAGDEDDAEVKAA